LEKATVEVPKKRLLKPVFFSKTYRDYLRYVIDVHAETRGFRARLAEAAQCQPSYLSQVLAHTASFSLDQLCGISRYLEHTDEEWEYLRELGILERAGSKRLREDCEKRLATFRKSRGESVGVLSTRERNLSTDDMVWYSSSWQHGAVFNSLASEHERDAAALAGRLSLPLERVEVILHELAARGFAERAASGWRAKAPLLFWQKSPLYDVNRMNWFIHGCHRRMAGYERGLHVGGQTSMSRAEFERARDELFAQFQKRMLEWAEPAAREGAAPVYLGLDFFEA
jgi:hypothetical protein